MNVSSSRWLVTTWTLMVSGLPRSDASSRAFLEPANLPAPCCRSDSSSRPSSSTSLAARCLRAQRTVHRRVQLARTLGCWAARTQPLTCGCRVLPRLRLPYCRGTLCLHYRSAGRQ